MPADQEMLFSLPLPLVLAALVLLGLLIGVGGWLLACRGRPAGGRKGLPQLTPASIPWLPGLLDALPCGAVLTDTQGRIELANGHARRWLGETGHSVKLPPGVQALVHRVAASGVAEGIEIQGSFDGDRRLWIEAALLGGGGGVLVLLREKGAAGVDTEVYQRLMQTIGHELRTPLTAIVGHADILSSCTIEEEALWRRSQQFIAREAERLARLVEDLLALSRLDRAVSALVPVNLRAVAEEAISATWQSAEERGGTLSLPAAGALPKESSRRRGREEERQLRKPLGSDGLFAFRPSFDPPGRRSMTPANTAAH